MYESRHQKPIAGHLFTKRIIVHSVWSILLMTASLGLGMIGYMQFENLPWRDAFLNAAMLLGGMGPVESPVTSAGKIFAGLYALYAGLIFIVAASVIIAPVFHRMLHLFHWNNDNV